MGESLKTVTPRKVVIVCPYLLQLQRGIERFCLGLADALIKNGVKVVIYTWGRKNENPCGNIDPNITIRKVPYFRYYRERLALLWYRGWLKMDNPDATILNFMYHGEEHLPKGRPYLYVLHSPASQIPGRYEYARNVVTSFKHLRIIAISKMVEDEARPYFPAIPMDLIYNGTDTEVFKPSNSVTQNEKFKIITAAAFEPRKGIHLMIEALKGFELNNQLEYHIYGGGSEEYAAQLQSMIKEYGLENVVKLKGSVTNLSDVMPEYDLFALPSKGEAFALSPIEAMACGVPILVSVCPPYPEFVTPDFGFMVNREDPKQIRQAIREMITNPARREAMKPAARNAALRFSWAAVVKQYINSIQEVSK